MSWKGVDEEAQQIIMISTGLDSSVLNGRTSDRSENPWRERFLCTDLANSRQPRRENVNRGCYRSEPESEPSF
jgi:hypothetical protein